MSKPVLYMLNTWYDAPVSYDGIKKSMTTGKSFIDDSLSICNFLAQTYNGILPHPQD